VYNPTLMSVPADQFESAAQAVLTLRAQGALRLLVEGPGPPGFRHSVRFVVRKNDQRVQAFFQQAALEYDAFRASLPDLAEVLTLMIGGQDVEAFVAFRTTDERSEDKREDPEVARGKYRFVEQAFPLDELKQRAWIKRTSKTELTKSVDWDISRKLVDDDTQPPGPVSVPYGTLRLETGWIAASVIELMTGHAPNSVILTLDIDDLDYLLDSLTRMRGALAAEVGKS
jgi:hypothetical protein